MKLEGREWREFFVKDIFNTIQRGKRLTKSNQIVGDIPYISSTGLNNGVDNFIGNTTDVRIFNNCLTIANSGSVGASFYHSYKFIASDHVTHLVKKGTSIYEYLSLSTLTNRLSKKYNFNREINDKRISREKLVLPIAQKGTPDWQFMEKYSKSIFEKKEEKYICYIKGVLETLTYKKIKKLEEKEWREFAIESIGEIVSGKDIYSEERIDGNTPYISATSKNNGIGYFIGNSNKTLEENCLSVNRNGSVGYSFYHPYKGLFSNDCRKIRLKYDSTLVGFFIANQITKQKNKYNYGYKMGTGRIKRQKILLPINTKNEPDYTYMEQYIKNMKYKKIKQYLAFKGEG